MWHFVFVKIRCIYRCCYQITWVRNTILAARAPINNNVFPVFCYFSGGKYNIKIVCFEIQTHRSMTNGRLDSPHKHVELVTQCVNMYVCNNMYNACNIQVGRKSWHSFFLTTNISVTPRRTRIHIARPRVSMAWKTAHRATNTNQKISQNIQKKKIGNVNWMYGIDSSIVFVRFSPTTFSRHCSTDLSRGGGRFRTSYYRPPEKLLGEVLVLEFGLAALPPSSSSLPLSVLPLLPDRCLPISSCILIVCVRRRRRQWWNYTREITCEPSPPPPTIQPPTGEVLTRRREAEIILLLYR